MNNQEMESDDDHINFEQKSVDYFKGQLNKLLDKDLTALEEQIQKLTNEMMAIAQIGVQDQAMVKLGDQLEQL